MATPRPRFLPVELGLVMRAVLDRLERLDRSRCACTAVPTVCGVPSLAPFLMRKSIGSMPHFSASSSIDGLRGECGVGRARSAVGRGLGPVDDHVVGVDHDVGDVVGRQDAVIAPAPPASPESRPPRRPARPGRRRVLPSLVAPILSGSLSQRSDRWRAAPRRGSSSNFTGWPVFLREQHRQAVRGKWSSCRRSRRRSRPAPP